MSETEARRAWSAEHTTQISLKLNNRTDADILSALEGKQKQTEIKRLIRAGMAKQPQP